MMGFIALYYVGHGGFVGINKEYFLTIANTREGLEGSTGVRIGDLSSTLRDHGRPARKYLILDSCFAASAFAEFQHLGISNMISTQTLELLPQSGTALLCSSGSRQVSLSPADHSLTMFSGALMEVLRNGEASCQAAFSLDEVGRSVQRLLKRRHPEEWIRPEVHSPDMREGDVAQLPIFPNPRFSPDPTRISRVGSAEWASMDRYIEVALEVVGDTFRLGGAQLDIMGQQVKDRLRSRYPQDRISEVPSYDLAEVGTPNPATTSSDDGKREVVRQELAAATSNLERSYDITLEALADALDKRGAEPEGHSKRVTAFTIAVARTMGLSKQQIAGIARGAFLHDIGNMAIPDRILHKSGKLSPDEILIMQDHCNEGYDILRKISFLGEAAEIVYAHHERYDGTGYPRGLKGDQIPLGARMFSVVDTLDAITSNRPYRPAQSLTAACAEIERWSGRQFDPKVVKVFLDMDKNIWLDLRKEVDSQVRRFASRARQTQR